MPYASELYRKSFFKDGIYSVLVLKKIRATGTKRKYLCWAIATRKKRGKNVSLSIYKKVLFFSCSCECSMFASVKTIITPRHERERRKLIIVFSDAVVGKQCG